MSLQPPRINSIKSKYVSSCCTGFHKPCLDVSSPPDLLPSPPVVCVHVFLPFVLQDIFIKAAISKLPFNKTKQAETNIRKQRGGLQTPAPRRSRSGGRGRAALGSPGRAPGPRSPCSSTVTHFTDHMATHSFGQPQHTNTICMHLNRNSFISQTHVVFILW